MTHHISAAIPTADKLIMKNERGRRVRFYGNSSGALLDFLRAIQELIKDWKVRHSGIALRFISMNSLEVGVIQILFVYLTNMMSIFSCMVSIKAAFFQIRELTGMNWIHPKFESSRKNPFDHGSRKIPAKNEKTGPFLRPVLSQNRVMAICTIIAVRCTFLKS